MPNPGSVTLMGNLVVAWNFDGRSTLSVTATLSGHQLGSVSLTPTQPNGQIVGTVSGNTATVTLHADFNPNTLFIDASETEGTKSASTSSGF
jgi:hypothetical protein